MEIRKKLLEVTKQSYREALFAGTSGNISYYDHASGEMFITPGSLPYETMTEEDLVRMTLDGEVLEGERNPHQNGGCMPRFTGRSRRYHL